MGGGEKKVNGEPTQQTQLFVKVDYPNHDDEGVYNC